VRLVEAGEADMPFGNQPAGRVPAAVYYERLRPDAEASLAPTTFHEANPGHHFQVALEQEMDGRPALRRFGGFLAGSAFTEGWGLYSERLADEMGAGLRSGWDARHQDARGSPGRHTGIHALGDPGARSRRSRCTADREAIETDRHIDAGQALYKIG
jgi:hypothetical protein